MRLCKRRALSVACFIGRHFKEVKEQLSASIAATRHRHDAPHRITLSRYSSAAVSLFTGGRRHVTLCAHI